MGGQRRRTRRPPPLVPWQTPSGPAAPRRAAAWQWPCVRRWGRRRPGRRAASRGRARARSAAAGPPGNGKGGAARMPGLRAATLPVARCARRLHHGCAAPSPLPSSNMSAPAPGDSLCAAPAPPAAAAAAAAGRAREGVSSCFPVGAPAHPHPTRLEAARHGQEVALERPDHRSAVREALRRRPDRRWGGREMWGEGPVSTEATCMRACILQQRMRCCLLGRAGPSPGLN